ncbi:YlbF family regulator [Anaeromicrobium sediminis]|uniref:YlbF family regulator n=1 Tax=Anaeromicrobium sediminis TaxID=1478221 RepID=A0A267MG64_9FIRM|nr:YlbF family regulator [Anaeromicrobium sediminis]PAB58569.1 hypothetical protein CCE28_14840 [Anaeromicrobium sediminis]
MSVQQTARALVRDIKSTKEFAELKRAKADIEKYKDLKEEIERFQRKQMEIFSGNRSKRESERLAAQLDQEFKSFSRNPQVNRFIRAGKNFNNMMSKLYKEINNQLDSELK